MPYNVTGTILSDSWCFLVYWYGFRLSIDLGNRKGYSAYAIYALPIAMADHSITQRTEYDSQI